MRGDEIVHACGMREVTTVTLASPTQFVIQVTMPDAALRTHSIYAFLIGAEICRIGSSKGPLGQRLRSWSRDLTARLGNMDASEKMATHAREASEWRTRLERHGAGLVFAQRGTIVTTPVGTISTYLDEESVLIGRLSAAVEQQQASIDVVGHTMRTYFFSLPEPQPCGSSRQSAVSRLKRKTARFGSATLHRQSLMRPAAQDRVF